MNFRFFIDWNDDTDFADTNENISEYVQQADWTLGMAEPYQLIADESTCRWVVDNTSRFFTPEGTSAVAGSILPGRRMRIDQIYNGSTVVYWNGWIDYIELGWRVAGTATGRETVTIYGAGPRQMLQDTQVDLTTYNYPTTAGTIIRDVLALVNLPPVSGSVWLLGITGKSELGQTTILANTSAYSDLDTGATIFEAYAQYETATGWDVISDVVEAERGRFYFGRDGRAYFIDQNGRFLNPVILQATGNLGTVTDYGLHRPQAMQYRFGHNVITSCRVEGAPRGYGDEDEVLWRQNGGWGMSAGGTAYQWAKLARETGEIVTATGVHIDNVVFSSGTASLSVEDRGAWQLITAIGGTAGGTIVGLDLIGRPINPRGEIAAITQSNINRGVYGRRNELYLELPALSNYDQLRRVANGEVILRKTPMGEITSLTYTGRAGGSITEFISRWTIGTALYIEAPTLGNHTQYYQIIGEQHQWAVGDIHTCVYHLERNYASNPYLLDSEIPEGGVT